MYANSTTFRKSSTTVTLERMGRRADRDLVATRPVDGEADQGDDAGQAEEEDQAEMAEFLGAERELEALDGAGGNVELGVAIHGPVHGGKEQVQVARVDDAIVGDEIGGADDGEAAALDAEREVRGLEALGDDHDAQLALQVLAGGVGPGDVADAVAGLAPRRRARGDELLHAQAIIERAAKVVAHDAGRAGDDWHLVVDDIVGDVAGGVGQEIPQQQVVVFREAARVEVDDDVVEDHRAPVEEQVFEAGRDAGVEQEDEAAGAGGEEIAEEFLLERLYPALRGGDDHQGGVV